MEDNEQVLTTEHEKKEKLETDAMFRLEHGEADRSTLKKALPTLSHIQEAQNAWKDDFALNSMLRRHFREKKKAMQEEEEKDQALQAKANLAIPLVPESEDDRRLAALLRLHTLDCECWLWAGGFMGSRGCRVWRHLIPGGPCSLHWCEESSRPGVCSVPILPEPWPVYSTPSSLQLMRTNRE